MEILANLSHYCILKYIKHTVYWKCIISLPYYIQLYISCRTHFNWVLYSLNFKQGLGFIVFIVYLKPTTTQVSGLLSYTHHHHCIMLTKHVLVEEAYVEWLNWINNAHIVMSVTLLNIYFDMCYISFVVPGHSHVVNKVRWYWTMRMYLPDHRYHKARIFIQDEWSNLTLFWIYRYAWM